MGEEKAFWLKDFLPRQIPDARVMTFGYNADVGFGQSTAEIIDHAKSLLASLVDKREEPTRAQDGRTVWSDERTKCKGSLSFLGDEKELIVSDCG